MASPQWELQGLIWSTLDAALTVPIHDSVPESAVKPYVSFGPEDWTPADAECIQGEEVTIQLDLWSDDRIEGRKTCKEVMFDIRKALHNVPLLLAEHAYVDGQLILSRIGDDPEEKIVHGVMQFTFMIDVT